MRQLKRLMLLLVFAGLVGPIAACESPTATRVPPDEENEEPDPGNGNEETGFIHFRDDPLILA